MQNPGRSQPLIILVVVLTTALAFALFWWLDFPLGVEGEWVWQRHAAPSGALDALDRLLFPALAGTFFMFVAVRGQRALETATRFRTGLLFSLLIATSWIWFFQVQQTCPMPHRSLKPLWVLYDQSSAGYFFEAAHHIDSTDEFLSSYEDRMREGEVLHIGTHPPGLFLLCRWCIDACEAIPALARTASTLTPAETTQAFRQLESNVYPGYELSPAQLSGLQLLMLLTSLAVVMTILPISIVVATGYGKTVAWQTACLWAAVPCTAIFFPKSDVIFPLSSATILMFWILSQRSESRPTTYAVLAGIVFWLGSMLSLAHVPVAVMLIVTSAIQVWKDGAKWTFEIRRIVSFLLAIFVCGALWSAASGCNIFNVWRLNLENHEGFYGEFSRTWWKWALVNPIELSLAIGPPIITIVFAGLISTCRSQTSPEATTAANSGQNQGPGSLAAAGLITFALLWLSGKNQGEAARLWCFMVPWFLFWASTWFAKQTNDRAWRFVLAAQLVYCAATVSRVNGFSF